ncbi:hypothetical protein [Vibrio alginolyticus]|uniref:hypothetical protein n=1 Tax=Vibrio alginolyticus TaxID=663 RepID=UPI002119F62A|nr:hypothetical protein [Vibrio alginolyticus]MCQ9090996.1 hypothetical protein [Vibrio alginolyticus]
MTRQNSPLTLSNSTFSDQRFAAGHESSPKNDISGNEEMDMKHQNLRLFIINCSSPCGTYMQAYCKDVLVFAETEAQALELAEKDPTIGYVKGAKPEIVGQFEIEQGVAYAHYARD